MTEAPYIHVAEIFQVCFSGPICATHFACCMALRYFSVPIVYCMPMPMVIQARSKFKLLPGASILLPLFVRSEPLALGCRRPLEFWSLQIV